MYVCMYVYVCVYVCICMCLCVVVYVVYIRSYHFQGPLPILQLSVTRSVGMAASAYHQTPAGVQRGGPV